MKRSRSFRWLLLTGLILFGGFALAQPKIYRWVDKDGIVRYGDRIPPEYADQDRSVMNHQGVTIGFEEGEITAEEQAELDRLEAIRLAEQEKRVNAARRDRMLLDTYLTVADIEDLRDRRLELIDSQIRVTEFYLANLHRRLDSLEKERARFAPINTSEDAPPLPEFLQSDLTRTTASINLYEKTLTKSRTEQTDLREAFALDIERFKELKGLND